MSLISRSRLTPQCTECMRSFATGYLKEARRVFGSIEHTRGKKQKNRGPLTIPVRLLADMSAFGRAGTIVPVSVGLMRNFWYSQRYADYLPDAERRLLKKNKTTIERDFAFLTAEDAERVARETPAEDETVETDAARPTIAKISPERSVELIENVLPKTLDFYRVVIAETPTDTPAATSTPAKGPQSEEDDAASVLFAIRAEDARVAQEEAAKLVPKPIYGSVSTQDVLTAVKAVLNLDDQAVRVALDEKDIVFLLSADEDATRIKKTGTYEYRINVRGSNTQVKRKVTVHAQEEQEGA